MKTLTISVADEVYRRASQKAAEEKKSVPDVVTDFLSKWTGQAIAEDNESQDRAKFLTFLDELAARPLKPGSSVGPLNREELYQRGVSGY